MNDDSHSFIVRVWREVANGSSHLGVWRGSIEHVGQEKRFYFEDLKAAILYVRQEVGWADRQLSIRDLWYWLGQRLLNNDK